MGEVLRKHGSLVAVVVDPCSCVCYTGSYRLPCAGDLGVHYQLIWRIRLKYISVGRQSRSGTSTH